MKKFVLTLAIALSVSSAIASINGNGYYRVKNYGTQRWAALIDNKGEADLIAGTADLHALQLNNNTEEILSDPASIVYITNITGSEYNLAAQGTSLQTLVGHPIYMRKDKEVNGEVLYRIWGTYKNVTKYIIDADILLSNQYGKASINGNTNASSSNWQWIIEPVDVNSANYFGAVPTVEANNGLYTSLFTAFAYKPNTENVKAYYIGRVGYGMAEMIEINGTVPAGSPVVIQCAGQNVADNKMEIVNSGDVLPNNALNGVYFNYAGNNNVNRLAYDPQTMRVLGKCSDGSLGFITADIDFIPANSAYIKVTPGSSKELKCVSTAQYDENLPYAPEGFYSDETIILFPEDDYTYSGSWDIAPLKGDQTMSFRFKTPENNPKNITIGVETSYGKDYDLDLTKTQTLPFSYGSPYSWVLSNYPGGHLTITLNLLDEYIRFESITTGIDTVIVKDPKALKYIGQTIYGEENNEIRLYNLNGREMAKSYSGSLDVSTLPKGVYVAKSGNNSLKIVR